MEKRPDGLEEQSANKLSEGLLLPIFAVAAVFLFIILCFYAYNNVMKNKESDQVVILDGDKSNFKQAPKDPGGMEVEHTDKAVFNTVTGTEEKISDTGVKVEAQETPVTKEQLAASSDDASAKEIAANSDKPSTVVINTDENAQSDTKTTDNQAENNKTVGGAKTDDAVAAAAVAGGAAIVAGTQLAQADNTDTSKTTTAGASENSSTDASKQTKPTAIADTTVTSDDSEGDEPAPTTAPKKVINAEVKKETDKTTGESKSVIQFKEMPKSMSNVTPTTVGSAKGAYYVQISSHVTKSDAESAWKNVSSKYSSEVSGYSKNITEATVRGKAFYRLSFGPFKDRGSASTQCGILKAKGQDCIVQKY